jgi:release factor glutamine methyltransferase
MKNIQTVSEAAAYIREELKLYYPVREVEEITFLLFNHLKGYLKIDISLNKDKALSTQEIEQILQLVEELKTRKPIQYVLGKGHFFGYDFKVTPNVLIPRPETEELVEWIINDSQKSAPKILDIGTGSGCIAIALSKEIKNCSVTATDINAGSLEIARENAAHHKTNIQFVQHDIFDDYQELTKSGKFDIIVSNPPYVTQKEKDRISVNVLDYEPHEALFVDDDDPLKFYERIGKAGLDLLKNPDGCIYFEINEAYPEDVFDLMENIGYPIVNLKKDIHGKYRMLKAEL